MRRTRDGIGDGDTCPVVPAHGAMLVLQGNRTQYCPHQSHDGRGKSHPLGFAPPTRKLWPFQYFAEAVRAYNDRTAGEAVVLPALNLEGFHA